MLEILQERRRRTPGPLTRQFQVILALMLRNMRTRFFGHGLGFLISIGWPLFHIVILLIINASFGRVAPYGDSLVVFLATGLAPFMTFQYMTRHVMISVLHTSPLLNFPAVKLLDLLLAGALLEVLGAACMIVVLILVLTACGYDVIPANPVQAAYALGAAIVLGFGSGIVNSLLYLATPMWFTGNGLLIIILYITSGIFFLPEALPWTVQYYLSYLPTLQVVEWMRSAYYDGYGGVLLDKPYTIGFGIFLIFVGLLAERAFRGKFLIRN
jgi:capsular polysaccharide transport system permease protein